ncbi:MAG: ATP-binding protein [Candidatus Omnitrophica bacterium]|nr:ATP-binding protein [Candidatus Omnitrophota bacterium]
MIISVASGKGGTGKTTVSTSIAFSLTDKVQFLDCDVEEPNAHIFIKPDIKKTEDVCILVPYVDESKCTFCGKCQKVCVYNCIAVLHSGDKDKGKILVFPELCHGCGACSYLCPQKCITEVKRPVGVLEVGVKDHISFVHGKLYIGEAMAPPVIRAVKSKIDPEKIVIIDAPPGTSCPVIASVNGSDFCILVTEPTPFGLNDLVLAVEVLRKMKIPFGVVINRADLGDKKTEEYCSREGIVILMQIPFEKEIASSYSKGIPIVESFPHYKVQFRDLVLKIKNEIRR